MPPGPVFNWLCVASSACDILVRVARVRASQIASEGGLKCASKKAAPLDPRARQEVAWSWTPPDVAPAALCAEDSAVVTSKGWKTEALQSSTSQLDPSGISLDSRSTEGVSLGTQDHPPAGSVVSNTRLKLSMKEEPEIPLKFEQRPSLSEPTTSHSNDPGVIYTPKDAEPVSVKTEAYLSDALAVSGASSHPSEVLAKKDLEAPPELECNPLPSELGDDLQLPTHRLQSSKVPSSRLGRLFHYGGLAASLGYGAASEMLRRTASPEASQGSVMMTEANITRLVSKLSRMRGAALKLGQFLSIQDTHVLPVDVDKVFRRVQDSAHYMPNWQMEQVLFSDLGPDWADSFTSFDRVPFAAASIGEVHTATLAAAVSPTGADARVAVKIQFPNIANSITSDLGYISLLLTAGRLLPKGLFLDRTMQVMKEELVDECDYIREAESLRTFRTYLDGDARFKVPWVWDGSTARVLVMEHVDGKSVGEAAFRQLDQRDRDEIAARIIELCLKELFEFRLMQTDPNFSNFLWNARTRTVELVDFGATRGYGKAFIDDWLHLLQAAADDDRAACVEWSRKVGYLTGEESQLMLDAHVDSMTLLATPFNERTVQPFAFGHGTPWADITTQIRQRIPVMVQHRLTPPPRETYSLNRKLSGAFLLAARLNATVDTRALWQKVVSGYEFGVETNPE